MTRITATLRPIAEGFVRQVWLVLVLVLAPLHAMAQEAPDCASVTACIAILREHELPPPTPPGAYRSSGVNEKPIIHAVERLPSYGDAAVEALLELMKDPNPDVQTRAGYALFHFPKINPRFTQTLIAAHRAGVGWLKRPIGNTGTVEAFEFLWASFLDDPEYSSNSQVFLMLPQYADRLKPRLQATFKTCRTSSDARLCGGVINLVGQIKPFPDYVLQELVAIAMSPDASADVQEAATSRLIWLKHPYGMTVLLKRLEQAIDVMGPPGPNAFSVDKAGASDMPIDWELENLIEDISAYKAAAVAAGPLLVPLLSRRDMPDSRAAAALALGNTGYRESAPALLAQASTFEDDWTFAYNAVESLARLGLTEARPVLLQTAQSHWHEAVRKNAARAVNLLDAGAFERPGVSGDGDAYRPKVIGPRWVALRYAGDRADTPPACTASGQLAYEQFFAADLDWRQDGDAARVERVVPAFSRIEAALPWLYDLDLPTRMRGGIMFVVKVGDGLLIGTNAGEFGGGVYDAGRPGGVRALIEENALAAFVTGNKLLIVTGLSHMIMTHGDLWIVDLASGAPLIERRVRLAAQPSGYALAAPDTLVIQSEYGDLGVRADGTLVDVRTIPACG